MENYNLEIVKILQQQKLIPREILKKYFFYSNEKNLNLGQVLIQHKLLTPQNMGSIVKMLHTRENKNNLDNTKSVKNLNLLNNNTQKKFGKYTIIKELGRGGMGVVYKVKQLGIKRPLVLKTLLNSVNKDSTNIKRFHKEAQTISLLQHENIIPIYDFGEEEGIPYFTMQYVDGLDFEQLINKNKTKQDELIKILAKVAIALDYAHVNGIVHRDVKPANILLDLQNKPYLADFGLVKWKDKLSSLTQSGAVVGTPFFLSPEQIKGQKKHIDHRSDIYALGIILYRILTGKYPFLDNNFSILCKKILIDIPLTPKKINPDLSNELNFICLKCISKNPNERYQHAKSFAYALENYKNKNSKNSEKWVFLGRNWWRKNKNKLLLCVAILSTCTLLAYWNYGAFSVRNSSLEEFYKIKEYIKAKKYNTALKRIDISLKKKPRSKIMALKAIVYQKKGNLIAAKETFKQALKFSTKDDPFVYFQYSKLLHSISNRKQALKNINIAINISPKNANYYNLRAKIHEETGQKILALQDQTKSKNLEKKQINVLILQINKYKKQKNWNKALVIASQIITRYNKNAIGYEERAKIFYNKKELALATSDMATAIKISPSSDNYEYQGNWLWEIGDKYSALSHYEKLPLFKKNNIIFQRMFTSQINAGEYNSVIATSIKKEFHSPEILLQIARAHYYLNSYAHAKKLLKEIQTKNQSTLQLIHYYQALVYYKLEKYLLALPLLKKVMESINIIELNDKYTIPYFLGEWELKNKNYQKAFSYLKQAYQMNPGHAETCFLLGNCYDQQKKYKASIKIYSKAIKLRPWDDIYYVKRAFAYKQEKQWELSSYDFLRSLELNSKNLRFVGYVYSSMLKETSPFKKFIILDMLKARLFLTYIKTEIDLFHSEEKKLSDKYSKASTRFQKIDKKNTLLKSTHHLLDILTTTSSAEIVTLAENGIMKMFHSWDVVLAVQNAAKKNLGEIKRIKYLYRLILNKHIDGQKTYFRKIISRYYMTHNKQVLSKMYQEKDLAFMILKKMINDSKENIIIRFYAAQILIDSYSDEGRLFLQKISQFPQKISGLIASSILIKNKIEPVVEITTIPGTTPIFLQGQIAKYLPIENITSRNLNLESLLENKHPKVSLIVAERLWAKGNKKALKIFLKHQNNPNQQIQAFVLNAMWNLNGFDRSFKEKFVQKYQHLLIKGADSSDVEIRRVSIAKMKNFSTLEINQKIKEKTLHNEPYVRMQAIVSTALKGNLSSILNFIEDTSQPIAIRIAPLFYFELQQHKKHMNWNQIAGILMKLMEDPDPRIRFIIMTYLTRANKGNVLKFLLTRINLNEKNNARFVAIGLIKNKLDQSKILEKLVKHKNKEVKIAALTSLVYEHIKNNNLKKSKILHSYLKTKKFRKKIAFGYSFFLYNTCYRTTKISSSIKKFQNNSNYKKYIKTLEKRFIILSSKEQKIMLRCVTLALELDPSNEKLIFEKGLIEYFDGSYNKSLKNMQKIKTNNALQQYWSAKLYMKFNQFELALDSVKKAIKNQPWNNDFINLQGLIHDKIRKK